MVLNNFKSKGLGKGLAALLGDNDTTEVIKNENFKTEKVSIHFLKPNRYQPRKHFDKKPLEELAQSIKSKRINQPIFVWLNIPSYDCYSMTQTEAMCLSDV